MDEEISFPFHFSFQRQNSLPISEQGLVLGRAGWQMLGVEVLAAWPALLPALLGCGMLQAECSGALGTAQLLPWHSTESRLRMFLGDPGDTGKGYPGNDDSGPALCQAQWGL